MLNITSKKSSFAFKALRLLVLVIFVGLSIDAGVLLLNVLFNVFKPEWVQYTHSNLDLTGIYQDDRFVFFCISILLVAVAILKAHLFYSVMMLMQKLDMSKPFSDFAVRQVTKLSYYTFAIGLLSYIGYQFCNIALHRAGLITQLNQYWEDRQAFILMALVIYVIAAIFKAGVDIQNENNLTI